MSSTKNDDEDTNQTNSTRPASLPPNNTHYAKQSYWNDRFQSEDSYEWLVSYSDVADKLQPHLPTDKNAPLLIVGCGNSPFSHDLYDRGGYRNITSIDYSDTVIDAMKVKYPQLTWIHADMTKLCENESFSEGYFACVIDKAAMDALMSEEGDVWNPDPGVVRGCYDMCRGISRVLRKEGGVYLQISFAQPHFREKYLDGTHWRRLRREEQNGNSGGDEEEEEGDCCPFGWDVTHEGILEGGGCFGHFLYIMKKTDR